jgi:cobalt/nickel transport system ATP-binding protein
MTNSLLALHNISHLYSGQSVLDDITLDITSGERIVILGANGCGKSTLLKIMNGLIAPAAGQVFFDGQVISPKALKSNKHLQRLFRQQVCLLFQNPDAMIFNPTVYDEIAFGLRQLQIAHLDERVRHWAEMVGVSALLERSPFSLSGGEKQKVCLASLLALEPKVLLMDEPTSAMDPRATGWLVDFLASLSITTVTTTHNLSLAPELGSRTLVLSEDHKLIYDGAIAPLFADLSVLTQANLVHTHHHSHGDEVHAHVHIHDWM